MYKVISIINDEMTRNIELENTDTGTIVECFDDSSLVSTVNFDFLIVGKEYECKIKLFGSVVNKIDDKVVVCKIVNRNEMIGTTRMIKVFVENDEYYIPRKKVQEALDGEKFLFRYTRKDLIQVDNVIHNDMQ